MAANTSTSTFTSVGAGSTTAPANSFAVIAMVWGGGSGAALSRTGAGGGFAASFHNVTPGQTIYYTVGGGGTGVSSGTSGAGGVSWVNIQANSPPTNAANGCYATGGKSANVSSDALASYPSDTNFVGTIRWGGGDGYGTSSGSGGGGAGSGGWGSGGAFGAYGGIIDADNYGQAGGDGGTSGSRNGVQPGGGGGRGSSASGNGAPGQVKLLYLLQPGTDTVKRIWSYGGQEASGNGIYYSDVPPNGTTQIEMRSWGSGSGADDNNGAGGGGAYAGSSGINVSNSSTIYMFVGSGRYGVYSGTNPAGNNSWANWQANAAPTDTANGVLAAGGQSHGDGVAGLGGTTAASIGNNKYRGGNANNTGGFYGGGGSAGSGGQGGDANSTDVGAAGTPDGASGSTTWGVSPGGGAGAGDFDIRAGGDGQIILIYSVTSASRKYIICS